MDQAQRIHRGEQRSLVTFCAVVDPPLMAAVAFMPRSIHTDLFPHHNFIQLRTLGAILIDRMRLVFVTGRGKACPASYYP